MQLGILSSYLFISELHATPSWPVLAQCQPHLSSLQQTSCHFSTLRQEPNSSWLLTSYFHLLDTAAISEPALPTSQLFGRLTQKGPNKKWSVLTNLQPNFSRFCTEKGQTFRKYVFNLLFSLVLGKSKKYYTCATDIDKENFCVCSTNRPTFFMMVYAVHEKHSKSSHVRYYLDLGDSLGKI